MGMTVILVKFQAYGCNGFHRIIGPVNAYPRPSCHFFPCFRVCLCFQNRPLPTCTLTRIVRGSDYSPAYELFDRLRKTMTGNNPKLDLVDVDAHNSQLSNP